MRQSREDILPFVDDRKGGAAYFGVSERTFTRWLEFYGFYHTKENYQSHKLSVEQVAEIRQLYKDGTKMKRLAELYKVTFATVSRVVHNVTHKRITETAKISVIYNITNS